MSLQKQTIDFTGALLPQRNPPTQGMFRKTYTNAENADYLDKLKKIMYTFMTNLAIYLVDNTLDQEYPIKYEPPNINNPEDFKINLISKYYICSTLFMSEDFINYYLYNFVYKTPYWSNEKQRKMLYSFNDIPGLECYAITGPRLLNSRYSTQRAREDAEQSGLVLTSMLPQQSNLISRDKFRYAGNLEISLFNESQSPLFQLIVAYFKQKYQHLLTPENLQKIKEGYSQHVEKIQQQSICQGTWYTKQNAAKRFEDGLASYKRELEDVKKQMNARREYLIELKKEIKKLNTYYDSKCQQQSNFNGSGGQRRKKETLRYGRRRSRRHLSRRRHSRRLK
jgi:hypothetical protein